jgi:hypothetical protein
MVRVNVYQKGRASMETDHDLIALARFANAQPAVQADAMGQR